MIHNQTIQKIEQILIDLKKIEQLDADNQYEKVIEKYGNNIIRVHWKYCDNARNNRALQLVCTWSNGDEGYIFA